MLKLTILLVFIISAVSSFASYELETILHTQSSNISDNSSSIEEVLDVLVEDDLVGINSSSASIDDILRLTVGATTSRGPRSSGESVQIRGMNDNKVFVSIDGSRQNFQSGHSSMVALDTENLKAVEVYKSPSTISNVGNIGGGVNFVTKSAVDVLVKGKATGSEVKSQISTASNEVFHNGKTAFIKNNYSGLISLSSAKAGNLKLNNGDTLGHSSYEDFAGLAKFKYKHFDFKYEYFQREDDAPIDPTLNPPTGTIYSHYSLNKTIKNNFSIKYENPKIVNAHIYINEYKITKALVEESTIKTRSIKTLGFKLNKKYESWNIGTEFYQDSLRSKTSGNTSTTDSYIDTSNSYPDANGSNISTYVEKNINIGKSTVVSPGIKNSSYTLTSKSAMPTKSDSAFLKKLKILHKIKKINVHASYSEGFNAPRVNEVFPAGLHSEGDFWHMDNFFIPNQDLKHETSQVYETGISFSDNIFSGNGLLEFQANVFENKIKNYIHMERIDRSAWDDNPINGSTQFVNISDVSMFGAEVELKLIYDVFDYKLTYSKVRGRNDTDDLYLQDLPADQYNLQVKYNLDKYSLVLGYLGHYSQEQNRTNPETIQRTDKTDSYVIHNIFLNKKMKHFDVNLRVDNLQNKEYRKHASHLYESARDVKIGFKFKINTL
jgi:hemoglobin/transferrin/lactoferrin receptor protein